MVVFNKSSDLFRNIMVVESLGLEVSSCGSDLL